MYKQFLYFVITYVSFTKNKISVLLVQYFFSFGFEICIHFCIFIYQSFYLNDQIQYFKPKRFLFHFIKIVTNHELQRYMMIVIRASKSPFANILEEYVHAERAGQENGHGECWRYYKACPKSLFASSQENKYL